MSCLEFYCEGCVLLYILWVDIDYGLYEVKIIFGWIGVKVWIYKGDIVGGKCELVVVVLVGVDCLCCEWLLGMCFCCSGVLGIMVIGIDVGWVVGGEEVVFDVVVFVEV